MTQPDTSYGIPRYLKEAPHVEAMEYWSKTNGDATPLTHTVWTLDFMALGSHNIACPVCFDAGASLNRDVTPGRYKQTVQPCAKCRKDGWVIIKRPRWLKWILRGWWE